MQIQDKEIVKETEKGTSKFKQVILSFLIIFSGGIFFALFLGAAKIFIESSFTTSNVELLILYTVVALANLWFFLWLKRQINEFGGRFIFVVIFAPCFVLFLWAFASGIIENSNTAGERFFGWMVWGVILLIAVVSLLMGILRESRLDRLLEKKLIIWGLISLALIFIIGLLALMLSGGLTVPWRVVKVGALSGLISGLLAALIAVIQMWPHWVSQGFVRAKSIKEKEINLEYTRAQLEKGEDYPWLGPLIMFILNISSWFLLSPQEFETSFSEFAVFACFIFVLSLLLGFILAAIALDAHVRRKSIVNQKT